MAMLATKVGGVAIAAALLAPSHALAYRTFADDPDVRQPARWADTAISWEVDVHELSGALAVSDIEGAAFGAWLTIASADCGRFEFRHAGTTDRPAARGDRRNSISVVSTGWSDRGLPSDQAAYTDVQIEVGADGYARIVEADIYLNFDLFRYGVDDPDLLDLQTVLTHEGLHAWAGLLHPCELEGAGGAPDCAALPDATSSALYPLYREGGGRVLSDDDVAGVCAVYGQCIPSCPMGSSCRDGLCEPDACTEPACGMCEADCGGGACGADGTCEEGACGIVGAGTGYCLPLGSTGTGCDGASDCASGLCLTSARVGSYCTFNCTDDLQCGAEQYCATVGARRVCAPVVPTCSAQVGRAGPCQTALFILSLFIAVLARRHRNPTP